MIMSPVKHLIHDFARLFFPHRCAGCGTDILNKASPLCLRCLHQLPLTNFHLYANNPVEKQFAGTLPLVSAASYCYFSRHTLVQHLLHELKYRGNAATGLFMGRLMGKALQESERFAGIEALVPIPLHPAKARRRGYNQAGLLCRGMAEVLQLPVITDAVIRRKDMASQTHKNRVERWQSMQEQFQLVQPGGAAGKHLLLADDVITTGSTLHACAQALLQAPGVQLSIATLAWASD